MELTRIEFLEYREHVKNSQAFDLLYLLELTGGHLMPQTVEAMNKPGCVICEFVMHRLREWLQDGHTQDELEEGLEQICALMPGSVKVRRQDTLNN